MEIFKALANALATPANRLLKEMTSQLPVVCPFKNSGPAMGASASETSKMKAAHCSRADHGIHTHILTQACTLRNIEASFFNLIV